MSEVHPRTPPELGHLVKERPGALPDYAAVIEGAKDLNIPPLEDPSLRNMIGSTEVTVNGETATVGWVGDGTITKPFGVERRQNIVVVEGGFLASITRPRPDGTANKQQHIAVAAHTGQPFRLPLQKGDTVTLSHPYGPDCKAWYICFYPKDEQSA